MIPTIIPCRSLCAVSSQTDLDSQAQKFSREVKPLGNLTVRDRVVQTAVVHVIEPILDATFHERSFGFRRGRGCHHALHVAWKNCSKLDMCMSSTRI